MAAAEAGTVAAIFGLVVLVLPHLLLGGRAGITVGLNGGAGKSSARAA